MQSHKQAAEAKAKVINGELNELAGALFSYLKNKVPDGPERRIALERLNEMAFWAQQALVVDIYNAAKLDVVK